MEQQLILWCDDERQSNIAPNISYEVVLNMSAAALFISNEAEKAGHRGSTTPPEIEDVLVSRLRLHLQLLSV